MSPSRCPLAHWIVTRRRDIPYGPYLCIATTLLVLWWSPIWEERAKPIFSLGWLIPALLLFCLVMLAGLLRLWRLVEDALFGPPRLRPSWTPRKKVGRIKRPT